MERITANLNGRVRRATLNGRPFLIAPMTMLVSGVLNGSQGPLFYPADEIGKDPASWNGMPVLLNHPVENGRPISGRSPAVWEKHLLGHVFHATADSDGRLRGEAWIDVANAQRLAPHALQAMEFGQPVELSTGLNTENEASAGVHNDRAYTHIARGYKPDHLAVLPDAVGACSIADGCGINNADEKRTLWQKLGALIFGADPVPSITTNAGGAGTEKPTTQAETDMEKKALIDHLIANCACWQEADRETLNALAEDKLKALKAAADKTKELETLIANADKPKPPPTPAPAPNPKPATEAEWLAAAPASVQNRLRYLEQIEQQEKQALVERLVANTTDADRPRQRERLMRRDLDDLRADAALVPAKPNEQPPAYAPLYLGAAAPALNAAPQFDENEDLDMAPPTINWAEEANLQRQPGSR